MSKEKYAEHKANLLKLLKSSRSIEVLAEKMDIDTKSVEAFIKLAQLEGYRIDRTHEGEFSLARMLIGEKQIFEVNWKGTKKIKFGVVSDTHLGNKKQQITHLNTFYTKCQERGIKNVYHVGDISDGEYLNRAGHIYDLFIHGADDFTLYIIDNYPYRKGVTTTFITGNHDHTFLKAAGYDIGKPIAKGRKDMIYAGPSEARIMLTPNCSLDMIHPLDGASYAYSYSSQKLIDSLQGGSKPNILLVGHHHKSLFFEYRNIQAFECGTFQAQTAWMRGKRLVAKVGGWIVEVTVDEMGTIVELTQTWVPFFQMIENDY